MSPANCQPSGWGSRSLLLSRPWFPRYSCSVCSSDLPQQIAALRATIDGLCGLKGTWARGECPLYLLPWSLYYLEKSTLKFSCQLTRIFKHGFWLAGSNQKAALKISVNSSPLSALVNWSSIGSDNGLSPIRRQAIIWTNAGILSIGPIETNFSEILIEILTFSFKKKHLKMSSAKWRPFCLGLKCVN